MSLTYIEFALQKLGGITKLQTFWFMLCGAMGKCENYVTMKVFKANWPGGCLCVCCRFCGEIKKKLVDIVVCDKLNQVFALLWIFATWCKKTIRDRNLQWGSNPFMTSILITIQVFFLYWFPRLVQSFIKSSATKNISPNKILRNPSWHHRRISLILAGVSIEKTEFRSSL